MAGLLLITPWDRLRHVAGHHYRWLPVRWLLRDRYDSVENLKAFDRPTVVVVAERDSIVPSQLGTALHASLPGPKRLVVIKDSDHNDWFERTTAGWWQAVVDAALGGVSPLPAR